jgi:hypothetical protein
MVDYSNSGLVKASPATNLPSDEVSHRIFLAGHNAAEDLASHL